MANTMEEFFNSFFNVFYILDCISLIIALLILLFFYTRLSFAGQNGVLFYFVIFTTITLIATILGERGFFNAWIYNLVPLLLSFPILYFFRKLLIMKFLANMGLAVFLSMMVYYVFNYQIKIDQSLNPLYYLFFSFFVLFYSVGYLLQEIKEMQEGVIFSKIEFWFIASLFIYATSCALLWSVYAYLEEEFLKNSTNTNPAILWTFAHNTILFVQCFVFSYAIITLSRKR
jgi:hypothetical protein